MAKSKRRIEYVIGLISGKFSPTKNADGKISMTFTPAIANKYSPLNLLAQLECRNMSDDEIKIKEGLRLPLLNLNRSEFQKTEEEKALLKKLKAENKKVVRKAGFNPKFYLNANEPQILRRA